MLGSRKFPSLTKVVSSSAAFENAGKHRHVDGTDIGNS